MLHHLVEFILHNGGQTVEVANDTQTHIVLHENLFLQGGKHQGHKRRHLIFRTVPILSGEGVEGEVFHAYIFTYRGHGTHRLDTGLVAVTARLSAFSGPAPIAIHDNGNMLWYSILVYFYVHFK